MTTLIDASASFAARREAANAARESKEAIARSLEIAARVNTLLAIRGG